MLWQCITLLASRQHGVLSRKQVLALGGSPSQLKWAVREGRLVPIRRGVYFVAGSASPHRDLMAACLAAGEAAAVSHLAAAALWGAEQVKAGRLEITTFDNLNHRLPGVATHRSLVDFEQAACTYNDLPVVVPALTVVQMAERCHPHLVRNVANDLVKRNWTRWPEILKWIDLLGDGRRESLRRMCEQALAIGGHNDSPPARLLCEKLIQAGVTGIELDFPVETPEGSVLLDIAIPPPKVALEYNGGRDHDGPLARAADTRRRHLLGAMGWIVFDINRFVSMDEAATRTMNALRSRGWP